MRFKLAAAILALSTLPILAQAQQQQQRQGSPPPTGPKPTVADVQRVIGSITADKAKTQVYCDIVKIDDQLEQAEKKKDEKQAQELANKSEQMVQKLGPEYTALLVNLQQVDPSSAEGKQIVAAFETLEKNCGQ